MADRCEEMLLKAGNLSQEEVAKVLKFIDDLKDDPRQAQKVIMESRALRDRAALAERQAPLAAATRLKFTTGILRATGKAIESGKKRLGRTAKSLVDAARSYYVSTNKDITGARNSVDAKAARLSGAAVNHVQSDMYDAFGKGWRSLRRDRVFTKAVVREMRGESSDNPMAKQYADIIKKHNTYWLNQLYNAGGDVKELMDYGFTTVHSIPKIYRLGRQKWIQLILPLLDRQRTFQGSNPEEFLNETWNDIHQGNYTNPFQYKGPPNIGTPAHRVLHFLNADAQIAYNDAVGASNPLDDMLSHIQRLARQSQIMRDMTPNPEAFHSWVKQTIKNESRKTGKLVTDADLKPLDREFHALMGHQSAVTNYNIAHWFDMARYPVAAAKLGKATISSWQDMAASVRNFQRAGMPMMESYTRTLKTFLRFLTPGTRAIPRDMLSTLKSLGVGMNTGAHFANSRFGGGADIHDWAGNLMDLYYRAVGLPRWDDFFEVGMASGLANHATRLTGKAFEDLSPEVQRTMDAAGITPEDWETLRKIEIEKAPDGEKYLTPELIKDRDLSDKWGAYLYDESLRTVPKPGAKQSAFLYGEGGRGEVVPELRRLFTMFKAFPLGVIQKEWPNVQDGGISGAAQYVIGSTMIGLAANAVKNLISGKEPDDIKDPHTWLEAAVAGGAGSVFSDIFAPYSKSDNPITGTFLGPSAEEAEDFYNLYTSMMYPGKSGVAASERTPALHILKSDVPLANLWFLQAAYQYGVLYPLIEKSNPGALQKMVARDKQLYNEKYWLLPPGTYQP